MRTARTILRLMALVALAAMTAIGAERPNVVIIYGDDVGYADVGVYGSKLIPTPNIEPPGARRAHVYRRALFGRNLHTFAVFDAYRDPRFSDTGSVCLPQTRRQKLLQTCSRYPNCSNGQGTKRPSLASGIWVSATARRPWTGMGM